MKIVKRVEWEGQTLVANKTWFDWEDHEIDQRDLDDFAREHPKYAGLPIEELYSEALSVGNVGYWRFRADYFEIEDDGTINVMPKAPLGRIPLGKGWDIEVAFQQKGPTIVNGRVYHRPRED